MRTEDAPIARLALAMGLLVTVATDARAQAPIDLVIDVGAQHLLDATDVRSYSVGIGGVADVRLTEDGHHFVIVGQRAGQTSLLVLTKEGGQRSYRIVIGDSPPEPAGTADYGPGTVAPRANVRLDVYFVRFDRSYTHQLGVAWPGAVGGYSARAGFDLLDGTITDASVVAEQALPRLDMAETAGHAKLLKHSALITANGSEAKFAGGGEVNVSVGGGITGSLERISYGSEISMRPRYDSDSGRVELAVHADISDLAPDRGTGIPGRSTSSLDALVNLELGQALVIAGLTSRSELRGTTGLPGLSRVPIVGALFGSRSATDTDGEAVILVVPSVIEPIAAEARQRIAAALDAYESYDGGTAAALLPAPPGAKR